MEPTRLEQQLKAEKVHYDELCRIEPFLKRGATIDNNTLRSLGVVKSAPLDVDNPILQASHQGTAATTTTTTFFLPCVPHDTRYPDLDHTDKWPGFWEETMDRNKATDPEWVQSARERYPQFRASFFTRSLWRILDLVLDEQYLEPEDEQVQKARTDGWREAVFLEPEEDDIYMPEWEHACCDYRPHAFYQPRDRKKPHLAIVMGDSELAHENEILTSELDAAIAMAKRQISCRLFSNHHTKPILIYTFMWETHGRITQAYVDPDIHKLVIRQSRIFDFRGKDPPPDAFLFLRWMMNDPVGETERKQDEENNLHGSQVDVSVQSTLSTEEAS